MSDEGQLLTREDFLELLKKLDKLPSSYPANPDFSDLEVDAIKRSVAFTQAFHHDAETLRRMEKAFVMAESFIKISQRMAAFLAFVVIVWTQWDKLTELLARVTKGD
jgi:hypothetical protein